jgi:thioredoxin 1
MKEATVSKVIEITPDNFQAEVLDSPVPVLLDFYGRFCPPCQVMMPVIQALAAELGGAVKVVKVDVQQNEPLAVKYKIQAVPTFIFIKNGQEVGRLRGLQTRQALLAALGNEDQR